MNRFIFPDQIDPITDATDYQELLRELDDFGKNGITTNTEETLRILNAACPLIGLALVESEFAWRETTLINVPLEDRINPISVVEHTTTVEWLQDGLDHEGYSLGFKYFDFGRAIVLSFTDSINPFDVGYDNDTPDVTRTFHVPIAFDHVVAVDGGIEIVA